MVGEIEMNNYHFNYSGEVVITADCYEEAEEQLKNMLRGVFTYHRIHSSVGMLAQFDDEELE